METLSMTYLKGWFMLVVIMAFLSMICGLAMLSTALQPQRWCERRKRPTP